LLPLHCNENPIYVFLFWELGICPLIPVLRPGSSQVENVSTQVQNQTRLYGDRSNPEEINRSNAMYGEPGLATGLTSIGMILSFLLFVREG
jgi:hypothetical protein